MKEENNYKVYVHINKHNDKKYFGITGRSLEVRWNNGKGYKGCSVFYNAIQKYGWDGFHHLLVADHLQEEEACEMEILLISAYKTTDRAYGYNLCGGGNLPTQQEGVRRRMSEAWKGDKNPLRLRGGWTEEEKQRLRERFSGKGNPRYGVVVSDETKAKISKALTGRRLSPESIRKRSATQSILFKGRPRPEGAGKPKRAVMCIETGIVYDSVSDAAVAMGKPVSNKSNICAACNGRYETMYGYHWKYVDHIS